MLTSSLRLQPMFIHFVSSTMYQALVFTSDFKLGHYMKIPPRPMFWAQVLATAIAGTVQLGVQAWMFSNIKFVTFLHNVAYHLLTPPLITVACAHLINPTASSAHRLRCSELHRSSGESSGPSCSSRTARSTTRCCTSSSSVLLPRSWRTSSR